MLRFRDQSRYPLRWSTILALASRLLLKPRSQHRHALAFLKSRPPSLIHGPQPEPWILQPPCPDTTEGSTPGPPTSTKHLEFRGLPVLTRQKALLLAHCSHSVLTDRRQCLPATRRPAGPAESSGRPRWPAAILCRGLEPETDCWCRRPRQGPYGCDGKNPCFSLRHKACTEIRAWSRNTLSKGVLIQCAGSVFRP